MEIAFILSVATGEETDEDVLHVTKLTIAVHRSLEEGELGVGAMLLAKHHLQQEEPGAILYPVLQLGGEPHVSLRGSRSSAFGLGTSPKTGSLSGLSPFFALPQIPRSTAGPTPPRSSMVGFGLQGNNITCKPHSNAF